MQIDFQKCREKIATFLYEFCNRLCKREHDECGALKNCKLNIIKIIDRRISFYSQNNTITPRKPKISYRYLKSGIQKFYKQYEEKSVINIHIFHNATKFAVSVNENKRGF